MACVDCLIGKLNRMRRAATAEIEVWMQQNFRLHNMCDVPILYYGMFSIIRFSYLLKGLSDLNRTWSSRVQAWFAKFSCLFLIKIK